MRRTSSRHSSVLFFLAVSRFFRLHSKDQDRAASHDLSSSHKSITGIAGSSRRCFRLLVMPMRLYVLLVLWMQLLPYYPSWCILPSLTLYTTREFIILVNDDLRTDYQRRSPSQPATSHRQTESRPLSSG
ncbi:hypothetical protein BDQ12DRAFT_398675 [Crucibulum laeve]|uniref:Uncharacterized protein n=1 Tax=Crucibulum laeve TaxID=68775 RepID=A0A5C3LMK3_9AGAR|nr:hypothetical protein BDQ12DRAFT_398675 [Crucibulum laeve]